MIASTTTVPSTCAAFAIAGYTGRIGVSNLPCITPVETLIRAGAFTGATVTEGPCASPIPNPLGNPSGIPIPLPNGASEGGSLALVSLPGNNVAINGRVMLGIAILEAEAEAALCVVTTGTSGFGISGTTTFGASKRNGSASGCSNGSAITTPATATCKPIDTNVVHRLLEET